MGLDFLRIKSSGCLAQLGRAGPSSARLLRAAMNISAVWALSRMDKTSKDIATEEDKTGVAPKRLHGADRLGMGSDGVAEVPADRIGGHPELVAEPEETKK